MKITIEKIDAEEESEVLIRCHNVTQSIMQAVAILEAQDTLLTVYDSKETIRRIAPEDIYYIEAIEKKTFIYVHDEVYESRSKLYELEELLLKCNFFRASKSMLVNLTKAESFAAAMMGRFEITLQNNEKVIISRNYVPELKKVLEI